MRLSGCCVRYPRVKQDLFSGMGAAAFEGLQGAPITPE